MEYTFTPEDWSKAPDPDFWYWLKIEFPDGQADTEIYFESHKAADAYADACFRFGMPVNTINFILEASENLYSHICASNQIAGVRVTLIQHYIKL